MKVQSPLGTSSKVTEQEEAEQMGDTNSQVCMTIPSIAPCPVMLVASSPGERAMNGLILGWSDKIYCRVHLCTYETMCLNREKLTPGEEERK